LKNIQSLTGHVLYLFVRPTPWNIDLCVIFSSSYNVFKIFMCKEQPYTSNLNDFLCEKQKKITEAQQESLKASPFFLQTYIATLKNDIEKINVS